MTRGPVAGHLRQLRVPGITPLQTFTENVFEFRRERIDVTDARRTRRHVLLGIFLKFDEIKIITAVLDRRRFGQGRR